LKRFMTVKIPDRFITTASGDAGDPPRNSTTQLKLDIKLTYKKNDASCGRLEVLVTMRCQLHARHFMLRLLKAFTVAGLLNRNN